MRLLREAFTPYEIACGGLLISWSCFTAGVVLALAFRRSFALPVMALLGVVSAMVAHFAPSCRGCGKSPMAMYLTHWGERRAGWPMGRRIWPERTCSKCGTPLDQP